MSYDQVVPALGGEGIQVVTAPPSSPSPGTLYVGPNAAIENRLVLVGGGDLHRQAPPRRCRRP